MSDVPQPVKGSIARRFPLLSTDLADGFYLDIDVALYIKNSEVVVIAPDVETVMHVAESLHRTTLSWLSSLITDHQLRAQDQDYKTWLKFVHECTNPGESTHESQGSLPKAKTANSAAS